MPTGRIAPDQGLSRIGTLGSVAAGRHLLRGRAVATATGELRCKSA